MKITNKEAEYILNLNNKKELTIKNILNDNNINQKIKNKIKKDVKDFKQKQDLKYSKKIQDLNKLTPKELNKIILSYSIEDIDEALINLDYPLDWVYFEDEIKSYCKTDKIELLKKLRDIKEE